MKNICDEIIKLIKDRKNMTYACGCKLNNLMQELSPKDNDFKVALEKYILILKKFLKKF